VRILLSVLVALLAGQMASAQEAKPIAPVAVSTGQFETGARFTDINGDEARAQRMRDLRSGPTLDRLWYSRDHTTWLFDAEVDHAGYRDQRYFMRYQRPGRVSAEFGWDQTPLFYASTTVTPFRQEGSAAFRLTDQAQAAVQNRTGTIAVMEPDLERFEIRARRDIAIARLDYDITRDLDVRFALTSTKRGGSQPWGASFGFSNAIELPVPIDQRTNDVVAAAEWSNQRGMVRLAYDGSWFDNRADTLVWDNPLRLTDQTHPTAYSTGDGSSQGRMSLWPDSTAHTVSAAGSMALPARSRAYGSISVGQWLQNEALLPHTINSAIAPIPLARDTAEASARITSMNYRLTSRPSPSLWLSGQYRLYDYDNRTPHFPVDQYVRLDGNAATSVTGGSEPFGYARHFVDLDASYTPWRFAALHAGYGQQHDDRTFRLFEKTTDRTVRASIDSAGLPWGAVRLQYDRAVRTGTGLDEQVLSDIGEQVSLRQFDIADRTRDRVTAILQVVPLEVLALNASVAIGEERRPENAFGLQDNGLRAYTLGIDLSPGDRVGGTLTYGFERYSTKQKSRQANPGVQFNDPTRDWWTDMDEHVHTVGLQLEIAGLFERASLTAGYDYVGSRAAYVYTLAPNSSLATPQPLEPIRNTFHTVTADVRYTLSRKLGLGVGYRFDGYDVDDFALSPGTLNSPLLPTFINTINQWRAYDAHTGSVRLLYSW
jgi:MtrB/PioB family decaheme-associated outer membrane protein